MLKCSSDRCVCAPHSLLLGTSTSPRLSVSLRTPIIFTLLIALITFSFVSTHNFLAQLCRSFVVIDRDRIGNFPLKSNNLLPPLRRRGLASSATSCSEWSGLFPT